MIRQMLSTRLATILVVAAIVGTQIGAGTAPAAVPLQAKALTLLADVVHGRDQAVTATFNTQMAKSLSSAKLANAWAVYQLAFGRYIGHGVPTVVTVGGLTVVRVPLHMGRRPGEFRITFGPDGRVAGLYLLRTGVPL